jgi:hypothetical protein
VNRFATRRLIDASATLDSADRALLNIWINRGLDDAAMARMTGLSEEAIAERRARVVAHLSQELGLPPEHVRSALTEIAVVPDGPADAHPAPAAAPNRAETAPADPPAANRAATAPGQASREATWAAAEPDAPAGRGGDRRRGAWIVLAVGVLIAALIFAIALGSSGSGRQPAPRHSRTRPSAQAGSSTSSNAGATSSTTGGPGSGSGQSSAERLVALPGGVQRATGTVLVGRTSPNLRLDLRVSQLPPASHGHYEIWLYDTLVSSQPLGRLRTGVTQMSVPLPGDARRYPWIDISFQPPGAVFHSGDSVLRAANPLFTKPR